jgi:hypothetical protein
MTPVDSMSDEQFGAYALDILRRELGLSGFARFLRVYRAGSGDYTRDRQHWLGNHTVEDLVEELDSIRRPTADAS